ncbi:MAG: hypothetical protein EOP09_09035, partial [Proteobacteria bacterium]
MRNFWFLLALTVSFSSCSPRYLLRPSGDKLVEYDDIKFAYEESDQCRLEATYIDERLEHSLIRFRVHNSSKTAFTVNYGQFRMEGEPFAQAIVPAAAPEPHIKQINKTLGLIDKRMKSPQWDGVSDIHTYLGAEQKNDETIKQSK